MSHKKAIPNWDLRYDDEIVGKIGASRIPPLISFRLEKARSAVIQEIDDRLNPHGVEPPAMIVVDINGAIYRPIARAHAKLVIRPESVGIYKGRLCVRSDTSPITQAAFSSTPTSNRCGIRLICRIAS